MRDATEQGTQRRRDLPCSARRRRHLISDSPALRPILVERRAEARSQWRLSKRLFFDLPLSHPQQWAIDYYLHYPALTILFYPPVFALSEAAVFSVFGVSQCAAVLTVVGFSASLAAGSYCLARRWVPPAQACAVALLLIGLPEVARWARQSMTDVPAFSFLVWSAYLFARYRESRSPAKLYGALFLFLIGLYTKQSIIFFLPVAVVTLWLERGRKLLRDRHFWIGGILLVIGLVPLVLMTLKFGQGNIQSVEGIQDARVSRLALAGWLYYFQLLPRQVGWVPVIVAGAYCSIAAFRKDWRPAFPEFSLLVLWFVVGYLFFSAVDLKDPRLDIFILLPLPAFAIFLFHRSLRGPWASLFALVFAMACFIYTLVAAPVPKIDGYEEAAAWIEHNAPLDATVVFSGARDGSFIFDLRALDKDRRHTIIRADKLLLRISIRRELGVEQKNVSVADVVDMLNRYGVAYIVAERDFWTDLKAMAVLQETLGSSGFEEVHRVQVTGNVPHNDKELRIYRNLGPLAAPPEKPVIDLPIIGRTFQSSNKIRGKSK